MGCERALSTRWRGRESVWSYLSQNYWREKNWWNFFLLLVVIIFWFSFERKKSIFGKKQKNWTENSIDSNLFEILFPSIFLHIIYDLDTQTDNSQQRIGINFEQRGTRHWERPGCYYLLWWLRLSESLNSNKYFIIFYFILL